MLKASALIFFTFFSASAFAIPEAYRNAAKSNGISPYLLYSMALVESGRTVKGRFGPWPWTLNISGKPFYFDTRKEAHKRLVHELKNGNEHVAVGPMQIYWLYNKSYFRDPWEALNPYKNIDVGAKVLMFFYEQRGSFEEAVGAYNSPNKKDIAEEYKGFVRNKLARVIKERL